MTTHPKKKSTKRLEYKRLGKWSQPGSNRRPPACKAGALPIELWPRKTLWERGKNRDKIKQRLLYYSRVARNVKGGADFLA